MRQRILVIDDDPSLAEMLTIVLRNEGFDTAVIADGSQALAAVRRELAAAWGADTVSVQTFSSESKQGVDEARAIVAGWLEL